MDILIGVLSFVFSDIRIAAVVIFLFLVKTINPKKAGKFMGEKVKEKYFPKKKHKHAGAK